MITHIKNANLARLIKLKLRSTKLVNDVVHILVQEGFIELESYSEKNFVCIKMKYKGTKQIPYITNIVRLSKPGLRVFINKNQIPKVWGGIGICLISVRCSL